MSDEAYYRQRAKAEADLAARSSDPRARASHLEMRDAYARLLDGMRAPAAPHR